MAEHELIDYLEKRAGEYHRGTVRYDRDDFTVLHLREDVRETRLLSQIGRMLKRIRPESSSNEKRSFPFGGLNATVRLFDEAIIIHFPTGNDRGVVVSMEPETARDLGTFVGECSRLIKG